MDAVMLMLVIAADTGWRERVIELAGRGAHAEAVALAETARVPWLAPHIASHLEVPERYLGWVVQDGSAVAYRLSPSPETRVLPVATAVDGISDWLDDGVWTVALDGALEMPAGRPVIHAASARTAALSRLRVAQARRRPPALLAYARDGLPASLAEIRLAAAALGGTATLLTGRDGLRRLREAAYDGTLSAARHVLIAAHAAPDPERAGTLLLELDDGAEARFAPGDTTHLQFNAELVVLSACETAHVGSMAGQPAAGFAQAGLLAGVGMTLLTRWRVDDTASAQFVAALYEELAAGHEVPIALDIVQRAFREGEHGERFRDPFYWAAWQLWGG